MGYYSDNYNETVKSVLGELDKALGAVEPETVEKFVQAVLKADQVYFVGVGRVLLSLQAICKRLAHLGIKTHYVGEITEPAITDKDLLVVGSGSGGSCFRWELRRRHMESAPKSYTSVPIPTAR